MNSHKLQFLNLEYNMKSLLPWKNKILNETELSMTDIVVPYNDFRLSALQTSYEMLSIVLQVYKIQWKLGYLVLKVLFRVLHTLVLQTQLPFCYTYNFTAHMSC